MSTIENGSLFRRSNELSGFRNNQHKKSQLIQRKCDLINPGLSSSSFRREIISQPKEQLISLDAIATRITERVLLKRFHDFFFILFSLF